MPLRSSLIAGLAGACLSAACTLWSAEPPAPRSGGLPVFSLGFEARVEGAMDLAVDGEDRVWVRTEEPDAFVRLDARGAVAERIPFTWPDGLKGSCVGRCPFAVTSSGGFVVSRARFDHAGRLLVQSVFNQSWDMAAGPGDTVVLLADLGLEVFDRHGKSLRRFSEAGVAPGRIQDPKALAVDARGRSIVADGLRLQIFSRRGRFLRAAELPAELRGDITWIEGLTVGAHGIVFVRLVNHPVQVAVFDRELRYLGALPSDKPWYPGRLVADRRGRLYSLSGDLVQEARPVHGNVWDAEPLTPAASATGASSSLFPVVAAPETAVLADRPVLPYRLHAATRNVADLAADPRVPGRLWLATEGGLVRYDPGAESWRRWNVADGLPEGWMQSVYSDGRRVFILQSDAAAVFDVETERFQSLAWRDGDGGTHTGGFRIAPDPGDPGIVWWFLANGVLRHEPAADAWTFFPAPAPVRDGLVLPDRGPDRRTGAESRLVVLTETEVWTLRPREGQWHRLCDLDDFDRAAPDRRFPESKLMPMTLSASPEGHRLWVGEWAAALLFEVDPETGKVTRPAWSRDLRCSTMRVVVSLGHTFVAGSRCFQEIGGACGCAMDPEESGEVRRVIADPVLPGLLWAATSKGLASLHVETGWFGKHRPLEPEPDGVRAPQVQLFEGRLWVPFANSGLSVLDPASGRWQVFPDLTNAGPITRSAANGLLLVAGNGQLVWFDPKTAGRGSAHAGWRSLWGSLNDVHHDEQGLWGTGYLEGKDGTGFGLLRSDGSRQIWFEGSRSPRRFFADPYHPGDFWMISGTSELVRFHAATGASEVIQPAWGLHLSEGRWLWIDGRPRMRRDLATGEMVELGIVGKIFPDLENPDRVWSLDGERLELCDLATGALLLALDVPGQLAADPIVLGDRLWLATASGLLEAPLDTLRPPAATAGAPPARCREWSGL